MDKYMFLTIAFLTSFFIGMVMIPKIILFAKTKRLFDMPDKRKVHVGVIPRLGGFSFLPCMTVAVGIVMGLRYYFGAPLTSYMEGEFIPEYMILLSSLFILYFIGLADDLMGVGYKIKFIVQITAASLVLFTGIQPDSFYGMLGIYHLSPLLSSVFTVFIIVLMVNAYNLIDGVDGLCSGLSLVALCSLSAIFIIIGLYVYAIVALAMAGILLAFFIFNVSRRRMKIFMGDTGSLTLGFLITFLCFKLIDLHSEHAATAELIKNPIALSIGIVFIPIFDTIRVFATRIKNGKSPFHADKIHIHHKLLELGFTHRQNTLTLLIAQIIFLAINLVTSQYLQWDINIILLMDMLLAVGIITFIEIKIKYKKQKKN